LFDNNKLEWIYQDAIEWVKDNQSTKVNEYDVCIIDSTDPTIGISIGLFSVDFYNNLKCLLKEGTIISQQCDTQEKNIELVLPIIRNCDLQYIETKK